jgi:Dolichol-phosphate mannosyltransferase subunit 3 (DPM3)
MLRYQVFLSRLIAFLCIWYTILRSGVVEKGNLWVDYAPIWAIVLLGIYAVTSVATGVVQLKDYPEAAAEIEHQIAQAKTEMMKRGIPVVVVVAANTTAVSPNNDMKKSL